MIAYLPLAAEPPSRQLVLAVELGPVEEMELVTEQECTSAVEVENTLRVLEMVLELLQRVLLQVQASVRDPEPFEKPAKSLESRE